MQWGLAGLGALLGLGLLLTSALPNPERTPALVVVPLLLVLIPLVAYVAWRVEPATLIAAGIVLSPLAGNWPQVGIPGLIAPDRLLLVAGIGSVILAAPAVWDRPRIRLASVHWLMLIAVIYVGVSALIAGTLTNIDWLAKIIDTFGVTPFLVFLVAPIAFRERRQRDSLLVALVVFGAYLSLTTLFERLGLNALVFPKYILDPNYGIHVGRGRGPFVEAVTNGFALYMCAVACAIALKQWHGEARAKFAGAVAILCVAGMVLSLERSVWLAATIATLVAAFTLTGYRRAATKAIVAVAITVALALLTIPGLSNQVLDRFDDEGTVHDRQNLTRAAVNMIEEKPLLGFGWGEFVPSSYAYFEQAPSYGLGNIAGYAIHNTILTYATELGLLGAVLWGAIVLLGILGGIRRRGPPDLDDWRAGMVAVAVAYLVLTNFVPPQVFPNLALWLWVGISWVGFQAAPGSPRRYFDPPPKWGDDDPEPAVQQV